MLGAYIPGTLNLRSNPIHRTELLEAWFFHEWAGFGCEKSWKAANSSKNPRHASASTPLQALVAVSINQGAFFGVSLK